MTREMEEVAVVVGGQYACFTRPETRAERISYPILTPSAAQGILRAILGKPEFNWVIRSIDVLRPVSWLSIRRNEVTGFMNPGAGNLDAAKTRDQRNSLILRDVAYTIRAAVELLERNENTHPKKYQEAFLRRVKRGAFFTPPYLGCREFSAWFRQPTDLDQPIDWTEDLGRMVLRLRHNDNDSESRRKLVGIDTFDAAVHGGRLVVPDVFLGELDVS